MCSIIIVWFDVFCCSVGIFLVNFWDYSLIWVVWVFGINVKFIVEVLGVLNVFLVWWVK